MPKSESESKSASATASQSESESELVSRVSQSPLRARKREPNSASHQPLPSALATSHPPLSSPPSSLCLQALPRCIFTCMFGPLETRCELRLKVPTKTLNRPSWPAGKEERCGGRREELSGSAERGSKEENATEPYKKLKKNKRKRTKFNFVCKQASAVRCECV